MNNKGYTIFHSDGSTKEVESHHTPIIDELAKDNSDESINNFYNPNHIPSNTVKIQKDGITKDYDVRSKEYKDLYDSGHLATYDAKTNSYVATPLKEVTVTAEAPQWLKDKRNLEKQYSKDWYIDNNMPKFSRSMGVSANDMHPNNVKQYEEFINNKVAESILKRNSKVGSSNNERLAWYNSLSEKERDIVNNSYSADKFSPAVRAYMESQSNEAKKYGILETFRDIDKLAQSVEGTPERFRIFPNAENNYENYVNPLMWIGDMAKGLGNVPKDIKEENYLKAISSITSPLLGGALGGLGAKTTGQFVKNTFLPLGGLEENIVKGGKNLVVDGLAGKLSKADKVIDATKILNKIDNNSFYRQIGKEGYEDAIKTGVIRSNPIGEYAGKAPYFVEGKDFDKLYSTGAGANGKKPKYIFEMPQLKNPEEMSAFRVNQQAEYSPYVAGSKEIPISQGKIYRLNNKNEYELIDATKAGSKVLNKTDDVVKPIISSVDDVGKQASKQWQLEELPGLHLKSTMEGQSISKIIEPKTGLVNVEQALGIIGKESGGADKVALIRQGLGENIPKKMDFNEFRKITQDQLIPLEKQFSTHASDYGINRLGYNTPKMGGFNNRYVIKEAEAPLENQTLILGNKGKFGRGSSAHGNPDETLGHIHFLRDAETPDVLTVTQIQSDAFQGTHRIMPKDSKNLTALEKQQKSLARMEELQERNKSILHKMKTEGLDEAGLPVQDYQIKQFEDIVKAQEQSNLFKKADIENFTQKQLLDKNHQERYLQELVDYAGKRGDVNKVRVPTSETAAKVQRYIKETNPLYPEAKTKILNLEAEIKKHNDFFEGNFDHPKYKEKADKLTSELEAAKKQEISSKEGYYSKEHQTILKKYAEQPKIIKKLFGEEPKVVTDSKGNTWYEFDIPKKFKEGKGEIKAFGLIPPAIGIGTAIQSQNQNKSEQ